jgi:hypothetical protein
LCRPGYQHFVVIFSAVNSEGDTAPRVGFIHNFKKSEFMVKKWDSAIEDISTTGEEILILRLAELYITMKP